jgi:hypothetical protein
MKLPDVYTDWRIMAGIALMMLGAANWAVGLSRTNEYSRIIARTPVLAPFTNQQRRISYATARMDFYHAAFLTGQALVLAGVALTLLGFIVVIRRDSRRAHHRLRLRPGDDETLLF